MLTDFQKGLLIDIFASSSQILATVRAIRDFEREMRIVIEAAIIVGTEEERLALFFTLATLEGNIRALREQLRVQFVTLALEASLLARTL